MLFRRCLPDDLPAIVALQDANLSRPFACQSAHPGLRAGMHGCRMTRQERSARTVRRVEARDRRRLRRRSPVRREGQPALAARAHRRLVHDAGGGLPVRRRQLLDPRVPGSTAPALLTCHEAPSTHPARTRKPVKRLQNVQPAVIATAGTGARLHRERRGASAAAESLAAALIESRRRRRYLIRGLAWSVVPPRVRGEARRLPTPAPRRRSPPRKNARAAATRLHSIM
jgi:hypothetical protein